MHSRKLTQWFIEFDKGPKRHRSDADWVYQRRDNTKPLGEAVPREEVRPVIHVSKPREDKATASRPIQSQRAEKDEILQRKILTPKSSLQSLSHEPRRFHISRSTMSKGSNLPPAAGVSKKGRASPIVFAERSRKRNAERALKSSVPSEASSSLATSLPERALKKPGTPRNRSPVKGPVDGPHRAPLPDSLAKPHQETMDKIATDMNQWVLNEIGANLHEMDVKKKQQQQVKLKYRPKVPVKSYAELYPEPLSRPVPGISKDVDMAMSEASEAEDDDGDWVIDEYIRVPVHTVKVTMNPSDVGVLVLDGEEDNVLFYGADDEEEDDFLEDDEDENGMTRRIFGPHFKHRWLTRKSQLKTITRRITPRTKSTRRMSTTATPTCSAMTPQTTKSSTPRALRAMALTPTTV